MNNQYNTEIALCSLPRVTMVGCRGCAELKWSVLSCFRSRCHSGSDYVCSLNIRIVRSANGGFISKDEITTNGCSCFIKQKTLISFISAQVFDEWIFIYTLILQLIYFVILFFKIIIVNNIGLVITALQDHLVFIVSYLWNTFC